MAGMKTADLIVFTGPRKPAKYLVFKNPFDFTTH